MARINGQSGCTELLVQGVHRRGLIDLNSLKDITYFRDNFNQLLNEVIETAKDVLSGEIESLKNIIDQLVNELKERLSNRNSMLLNEKEQIIEEINNQSKSKMPKRLKILETKFEKILKKPFKKDQKKINKLTKEHEKMELKFDKTINKRTKKRIKQMNNSKKFIEQKSSFIPGAIGEERVIHKLMELPDSFIIFNDLKLSFSKAIRWRKYNEYVKSCQIDHVIIGPSGIFLIETKNWNPATLQTTNFLPHKQVDRAGYICFIKFKRLFRKLSKKIPIRSIVVTLRDLPIIDYPHVKQLTPQELLSYISWFNGVLTDDEVDITAQWLIRESHK
ncbi:MAG: NERD domain-containing protein [Promethearchaeota archaeon]